jgi:hypothetical protein
MVSASTERMRGALKSLLFKFLYAELLTNLEDSRLFTLRKRCRVQKLQYISELALALYSHTFTRSSLTASLTSSVEKKEQHGVRLYLPDPSILI